MIYRYPNYLTNNIDDKECSKCHNEVIIKEELHKTKVLSTECKNCSNCRPFSNGYCFCTYKYEDIKVNIIICNYCLNNDRENEKLQEMEMKEKVKNFYLSSPKEKLEYYGIYKLKYLLKKKLNKKRIKNMTKEEMIEQLSNLVVDDDFPIRIS